MTDGVLLVNKQQGITSFDVVAKLRSILHVRRVGHCGTLDPLATGLLVVCVAKATKIAKFISGEEKEYIADFVVGKTTDTYDRLGVTVEESDWRGITEQDVANLLHEFVGEINQSVPRYSAAKVDGKPMYALVRKGIEPPERYRRVTVKSISVIDFDLPHVRIKVCCSRGTYIRSLVHDIGGRLECGAYLFSLTRTRVGKFSLDAALTIGQIQAREQLCKLDQLRISLCDAVNLPEVRVSDDMHRPVSNGVALTPENVNSITGEFSAGDNIAITDSGGKLLAVAEALMDSVEFDNRDSQDKPVLKYLRVI